MRTRTSLAWLCLGFAVSAQLWADPPQAVVTVDESSYFKDVIPQYFSVPTSLGLTLTRGHAPFAVFFEGWQSTPRDEIVKWAWDFGPGTEGDELGRTFDGFNAVHVFETPGTYEVSLRVMNTAGEWSPPASITIEALSRDTENTYYVDAEIGDDSYTGLCQTVSGSCGPWRTADKAFGMLHKSSSLPPEDWPLKPGERVLFRRGQTFPFVSRVALGHGETCQGIQFGAYGDPADPRPRIQWNGTTSGATLLGGGGDEAAGIGGGFLVFSDLHFDFWNRSNDTLIGGLVWSVSGWKNILVLRSAFDEGSGSALGFNDGCAIFMVSSSVSKEEVWSKPESSGGTHLWGGPSRLGLVNNQFDKSGNHIAYLTAVDKAIIARNVFSRPAFGRTALRITGGPTGGEANNIHIIDNLFLGWIDPCTTEACPGTGASGGSPHNGGGTRYNYTLITFPPGANEGELLMEHAIFERNVVTNFEVALDQSNTSDMIIRNNLFVTPIAGRALTLGRAGSAPLIDFAVYGNTILTGQQADDMMSVVQLSPYSGSTAHGDHHENVRIMDNIVAGYPGANPRAAIELTGTIGGLLVDSNDYSYPSAAGGQVFRLAGTSYALPAWQTTTGYDISSQLADPGFVGPVTPFAHAPGEPSSLAAGVAEADHFIDTLRLAGTSPLIDAGTDLGAALRYDFDHLVRPADGDGNGTAVTDIGAFEYGAGSVIIPPGANVLSATDGSITEGDAGATTTLSIDVTLAPGQE
jgi:PKD repeat protein